MYAVIDMSFDGVFIRHLLEEVKPDLIGQRINRIHNLDRNSFVFVLANRKELLLDFHADSCHFRFLNAPYVRGKQSFPLFIQLKKHLEGSRILSSEQAGNDRVVLITLASHDELGFPKQMKLVLELFGRNGNLILLDEEGLIIDCLKKTYFLSDKRIIVPKAKYELPDDRGRINPYNNNRVLEYNQYQGVSKILYAEIRFQNDVGIVNSKTEPVLIKTVNKDHFYCFPLRHLGGETTSFPSLSLLLEHYYLEIREQDILNSEQRKLEQRIQREGNRAAEKMRKQKEEFREAQEKLGLEKIGNLLGANLHLVPEGAAAIEVEDFYAGNQKLLITLNPELSPAENLEEIFLKYKKAKRTVAILEEQIKATEAELLYWETLALQLQGAGISEIREILEELRPEEKQKTRKNRQKPQITTYETADGALIMVGKNNLQNNYLTHELANKNDYFFHVQGAPGAHTILRCKELTPELVKLAGTIAAYHSRAKHSENVPVDYTLVRNVKKVPKTKGSFVTYRHQKTVFVTPDRDYIEKNTQSR